tara:strand:+ start:505 stop:1776 length:1272 start_codon:yes stop_codon:yes gene_type:complete
MNNKILDNYFFILFSLIPASIIFGPAISFINILLIDFSFIFLLIYTKDYKFLLNKTVKIILIFCLYLIFNAIISKDFSLGALRNFGFIRFAILFCAFNYFFYHKSFFSKILITWTLTLFIIMVDVYIESITGKNIFGYSDLAGPGGRIVSFFKNEQIIGGYMNGFFLIIIGYLFFLNKKLLNKYKNLILIFAILFFVAILLTGERSNTIKALFSFLVFYFYNDYFRLKEKCLSVLLFFIMLGFLFNQYSFLNARYVGQLIDPLTSIFQSSEEQKKSGIDPFIKIKNNIYVKLYDSGFTVFKNYPIFGVGNKNYRLETCEKNEEPSYVCSTHPHQIYFEFMAEHGLIGSTILLFILFNLIFGKMRIMFISKNYLQIGSLIFLSTSFIPFLPSGAFFGDFNLTIFWVNLSIMYSVNRKTNIFASN